jgi:KipI family sensor histidine kinase inhibitor
VAGSVRIVSAEPLGESALLLALDGPPSDVALVARYLAAQVRTTMSGVRDVLPAYRTLLARFDPDFTSMEDVHTRIAALLAALDGLPDAASRLVRLPVCYGGKHGPDLEDVARHTGLTPERVVALHAGARYRVEFLGFSPGFPYLSGLPAPLVTPRLDSPRLRVPAGSVGIAGSQTGFYPLASPGGWRLIGRIPAFQIDITHPDSFPYAAGDSIQFEPIDEDQYDRIARAAPELIATAPEPAMPGGRGLRVPRAGPGATVQDLGRVGWAAWGYAGAGVLDREAAHLANVLVGNSPASAVIELTLDGGAFQAVGDLLIAVAGADLSPEIDGTPLPMARAAWLRDGMRLSFGRRRTGVRAYLAVAGGITTPPLLGSRSTDLLAGVGGYEGRALRAGDCIPVGDTATSRGFSLAQRPSPEPAEVVTLHMVWGPQRDWFAPDQREALLSTVFQVSARSDRTGVRLTGGGIRPREARDLLSEGMVPGSIQVPPGGEPIVLLADGRGIGGYPKIGVVIGPDLARLAQIPPGGLVRFVAVSLEVARAEARAARQRLDAITPIAAPETAVRCLLEQRPDGRGAGYCPRSPSCLLSQRCAGLPVMPAPHGSAALPPPPMKWSDRMTKAGETPALPVGRPNFMLDSGDAGAPTD